jgi:hypothetical protein
MTPMRQHSWLVLNQRLRSFKNEKDLGPGKWEDGKPQINFCNKIKYCTHAHVYKELKITHKLKTVQKERAKLLQNLNQDHSRSSLNTATEKTHIKIFQ